MNDIKILKEQEVLGKQFKVYGTPEEPIFLAKDVAEWLELSNATDMVSRVDEDEVTKLNLGGFIRSSHAEPKADCKAVQERS